MSDIQTPEGSFVLKESVCTSLSGGSLRPVRHGGVQSSEPACIAAVTRAAGDVLAAGEDLSQPRSDVLPLLYIRCAAPVASESPCCNEIRAEKNWALLRLATVFFILWMFPTAQL